MKSIFRDAGYETEERYFDEQNKKLLPRQSEPEQEDPSAVSTLARADAVSELTLAEAPAHRPLFLVSGHSSPAVQNERRPLIPNQKSTPNGRNLPKPAAGKKSA